ncbi:tetrahydrofolate dehydrogenase/cyclohydrolase catalytic domain-containing protein [Allokutzneria oryzae]|uniref:Tetrahydrofolate dehydrogenase/cyclohydrolase catalytic domain-containing protein n=1 Tax=Allokutzneria oryzae TaxID=1378989 RepID=A0ABV6A6F0_9PSEU
MRVIDGAPVAEALYAEVADAAAALPVRPLLAVLVPQEDPAGVLYGEQLSWDGDELGIDVRTYPLPIDTPAADLAARLTELSADPGVHGLSLAEGFLGAEGLGERIDPAKDVECANPVSLGRLSQGVPAFSPAVPVAVMKLLRHAEIPLAGTRAVVVAGAATAGLPMAIHLRAADATVTLAHRRTPDLAAVTAGADVLVSAVGEGGLITAKHVRPGATVVSVGLDRTGETPDGGTEFGGLISGAAGDAEAKEMDGTAGTFIGALTVGALVPTVVLRHVVTAAAAQLRQE